MISGSNLNKTPYSFMKAKWLMPVLP